MAEEIQLQEIIEKVEPIKLAKASVGYEFIPGMTSTSFGTTSTPDKLYVPDKWPELVKMIKFYYKKDPIASSVIDKSVDIGINELINNQGDSADEVFEVYESFKETLYLFLKDYAREYLLSGLLISEVNWEPKDINGKVHTLPSNIWLRDPATIIARKTPIPNRINYYVQVDDETVQFVLNKGTYSDGTKDLETYRLLVNNYPEFVKDIRAGETEVQLKNYFMVLRRSPMTGEAYPKPYMLSVLEALTYKRRLRQMDYSIASRVISAIQLITLGNDEFPITEGDRDQIEDLRAQIRHEGRENNIERVFQLFGNHTLNIQWIFPDVKAMLDKSKYDIANSDIMFGLGFPRILLSGETEKSATSSPEFAMFSPSETLKAMRNALMPFVKKLYKEIARMNGFSSYPTPEFADLSLYDVSKMASVTTLLREKSLLSNTSTLKTAGYDFMTEIENIVREREVMKENDIPEFNAMPYSPQPKVPGQAQPDEEAPTESKSGLLQNLFKR